MTLHVPHRGQRRLLALSAVLLVVFGLAIAEAETFLQRISGYCGQIPIVDPLFALRYLEGAHPVAPTSLQFGPDNRLYVSQQNGVIQIYTVSRERSWDYEVVDSETVTSVQELPNHDDDGRPNLIVQGRLVTGFLVAGTADQPVVYVSSSDPRVGDPWIDTNWGVISQLTGEKDGWKGRDLVRGLPRSRFDHAPNGLQLDAERSILYLAQGSNTNAGAASTNFHALPEYALSGAILAIDPTRLPQQPYDLPTLDDEDHPGNPDENDPFGGDGGKNQAILVPDGPVRLFATGFRNAYDLVRTDEGFYLVDNGPNQNYGGPPQLTAEGKATNHVVDGGVGYANSLHYIPQAGYYGGHPNPTRANCSNTFNERMPQCPVPFENSIEARFLPPGLENSALTTFTASNNGITVYNFSAFGSRTKRNLLTAAMNARIHLTTLNSTGRHIEQQAQLLRGGGAIFLDVVAQSDKDPYPGTIWVLDYRLDQILVLQPIVSPTFVIHVRRLSRRAGQAACEVLYSCKDWLDEIAGQLSGFLGSKSAGLEAVAGIVFPRRMGCQGWAYFRRRARHRRNSRSRNNEAGGPVSGGKMLRVTRKLPSTLACRTWPVRLMHCENPAPSSGD